jgi:excinuclease UvrABC nuclease subunit
MLSWCVWPYAMDWFMLKKAFKASSFPKGPGVYLMRDAKGTVLYVGKARSLRQRLRSYFGKGLFFKERALQDTVDSIETFITPNEDRALILECDLIQHYRPRFNVVLKEGKGYPCLTVSRDIFPRLSVVYPPIKGEYYGPYPQVGMMREVFALLQKVFQLRTCDKSAFGRAQKLRRPCLQYQMQRCTAPCVGFVTEKGYQQQVLLLREFLKGKDGDFVATLDARMKEAVEHWNYEEAQYYRDMKQRLKRIQNSTERRSPSVGTVYEEGWRDLALLLDKKDLERVEAYDVSHWQGTHTRISCVVFGPHGKVASETRVFKTEKALHGDDIAALKEGLRKRFSLEAVPPDLFVIDGGATQREAVEACLSEQPGWEKQPVWSLVKGEGRRAYYDRLLIGKNKEGELKRPAGLLLQGMRDQAHRMAIAAHRRSARRDPLLPVVVVPGLGDTKWRRVLMHFGGWQGLRQATVGDITMVSGVGTVLARRLYKALQGDS